MLEPVFNKVAGLKTCKFNKKKLQHKCFPVNVAKSLKTPISKNFCKRPFLAVPANYVICNITLNRIGLPLCGNNLWFQNLDLTFKTLWIRVISGLFISMLVISSFQNL